jgi:hypothetical protein
MAEEESTPDAAGEERDSALADALKVAAWDMQIFAKRQVEKLRQAGADDLADEIEKWKDGIQAQAEEHNPT